MGKKDNRRTRKMIRRRGQKRKNASLLRSIRASEASQASAAAKPAGKK